MRSAVGRGLLGRGGVFFLTGGCGELGEFVGESWRRSWRAGDVEVFWGSSGWRLGLVFCAGEWVFFSAGFFLGNEREE